MNLHPQNTLSSAETVTIKQVAEALGRDLSSVKRRAAKQQWLFREEAVRGGRRRLYPIASLPPEIRQALNERAGIEAAQAVLDQGAAELAEMQGARTYAQQRKAEESDQAEQRRAEKAAGMRQFAALPADSPRRLRAKARETALLSMWQLRRERKLALRPAMVEFVRRANEGEVGLPDHVWQWMPTYQGRVALTEATLRRWHYDYQAQGLWGLVDGYGVSKGRFKVREIEGLEAFVIGLMVEQPHIGPKQVKDAVKAIHPDKDQVSLKGYERFMKQWKADNAQAFTYVTNPDAWKNQYMAAVGSQHERIVRLNQVWELDSTPGDWELVDGRHSVIGVIDLYSRRFKLYVSKTSTARAICQVFRRAALDWGICEAARTDNGKDYTSNQFTSVLRDLEVAHELCMPFASEQKGTVERTFRTMSHGILELLPGFIGHNVAERKAIEARKSFAQRIMTPGETVKVELTSEELQQRLDEWCRIYHHQSHQGLDGKSPFEVATAWTQPVRRIQDERALDLLLAEIGGTRVVSKKGIRFEGHSYDAPELFEHVGREAVLKRDEADIGRLYVYVEGEFVAVAECAELLGISRRERAAAAKAAQKKFLAAQRREYQDYNRQVGKNIGQLVIEHQLEQCENIETLHRPSIDYTPEGLKQAGHAARHGLSPQPTTATPEQDEARRQLADEMAAEAAAPVAQIETPRRRFQRWQRLDQRVKAGEVLTSDENRFYTAYPRSAEYAAENAVYEDCRDLYPGART